MGGNDMKKNLIKSIFGLFLVLAVSACGSNKSAGGKGMEFFLLTPQAPVVSGVAAAGIPLSGTVYLKDSADQPRELVLTINADGTFSFDVTEMTAPFLLKAVGSANGKDFTLYSLADGNGIANVNPMSNLLLTYASGGADLSALYDSHTRVDLLAIAANIPTVRLDIRSKLQSLLEDFDIAAVNPIEDAYTADHEGLDGMLDAVSIDIKGGTVTITNTETAGEIYTSPADDPDSGTVTPENIPVPAPAKVKAYLGAEQIAVSWKAVSAADSYNIYWSTSPGVTKANGKKIKDITASPYKHTKLTNGTTYYYIVTAVKGSQESAPSAEVSAKPSAAFKVCTYNTNGDLMTCTTCEFNSDGMPVKTFISGPTGLLISEMDVSYNDNRKITDTKVYGAAGSAGPVTTHSTYDYDGSGFLIKNSTFDANDDLAVYITFVNDAAGKPTTTSTYNGETDKLLAQTIAVYNAAEKPTEIDSYANGLLISRTVNEYTDDGKLVIKSSSYDINNDLTSYTVNEYNDAGKLIKTTNYNGFTDAVTGYSTYELNDDGMILSISKFNFSGLLTEKTIYEYNEAGCPTKISTYGPTGLLKQYTTVEYI
jgi:hypothetical protein